MPPLQGFSDNPLVSRDDVSTAAKSLLYSLQRHQSPGGARIRIPVATGAHFDAAAADLEGYSRSLWAVAALIEGRSADEDSLEELVAPFVRGLANGTDPDHPEYWGALDGTDQRMVEMEIISFALLAAPDTFYHIQDERSKANIICWLRAINDHPLPLNNWLFFRVMTNLALMKTCGVPRQELWPSIEKDLEVLDSFYLGGGWSSDGPWSDKGRQADYYSGSFAIQFSQLLYIKYAFDFDSDRCAEYWKRAEAFATDFMLYFDKNGAAIPFGRSLTYRFAFAGFWSAAAYAEVELPSPLSLRVVKGLLLRHLRWWTSKPDIFKSDGTLNIGHAYPNMYMCEDYNSPQSVYWSLKSFIALGLPSSHAFWSEKEQSVPQASVPLCKAVTAPHQIVCNTGSHHFFLSSGQYCPWPLKATEAKYGKFAYSSHFGFSVPTGPLIQQMAPDSTLALSIDNGESWRTRWIPLEPRWSHAVLRNGQSTEELPMLISSWRPWSLFDIEVSTALIAPSSRWSDWHIRLHKVKWSRQASVSILDHIKTVEGGFAIDDRKQEDGRHAKVLEGADPRESGVMTANGVLEATVGGPNGCCVFSSSGASGVRSLSVSSNGVDPPQAECRGSILQPDTNTNLLRQRTVIPTIESSIPLKSASHDQSNEVHVLAVAVFATSDISADLLDRWSDVPVVCVNPGQTGWAGEDARLEVADW